MKYISTRGDAPELGFSDAVLAGLGSDGGLYVPLDWPQITKDEMRAYHGQSYAHVAYQVIEKFVGNDVEKPDLERLVKNAYRGFRHQSIAPLLELVPGHFVLELFYGPTLAFKDVAMQFLALMIDHILGVRNQRATIVGATSGDTGSAAIEAFRGRRNTDIFILHPEGRVSPVQRRQMTTVLDQNVHNIGVRGTFDDCQRIVKNMFVDQPFKEKVALSGVNSINWGRIVAQVVYYVTSAVSLGAPDRQIAFTVPTGNFGDIFAGFVAKQMGVPIQKLVIATNTNDILRRVLDTGLYEPSAVIPTSSPSMDVQISSNFERALFDMADQDTSIVAGLMNQLSQSGRFQLNEKQQQWLNNIFAVDMASEEATIETIRNYFEKNGYLLDPHTAVGVHVADKLRSQHIPMVTLSTAHPAKFPAVVFKAAGIEPPLPNWLEDLFTRKERLDILPNEQKTIQDFVAQRIGIGQNAHSDVGKEEE